MLIIGVIYYSTLILLLIAVQDSWDESEKSKQFVRILSKGIGTVMGHRLQPQTQF